MILRNGKRYFIELNQPFRLILLPNKVPNRYKVKILLFKYNYILILLYN